MRWIRTRHKPIGLKLCIIRYCVCWGSKASSQEFASFEIHDEYNSCRRWIAVGDLVAGESLCVSVGANKLSWTIHVEVVRTIPTSWTLAHILASTVDGTERWALRFGSGVRVNVERNLGVAGEIVIPSEPIYTRCVSDNNIWLRWGRAGIRSFNRSGGGAKASSVLKFFPVITSACVWGRIKDTVCAIS